jgi:8-oxo-dGTP pyrophosphatase MutT (NUDIX family)
VHIGRHIIQELVRKVGQPTVERWTISMEENEFNELKKQIERGRAHDVTVLIGRGNGLAVIRKPQYPSGAYRIPSGGVRPEESFIDGAVREAKEETGLDVEIERYLLHVLVTFTFGREYAKWSTHVLSARALTFQLAPTDTKEIAEAKWVSWDELLGTVNTVLRDTGLGGLNYRARLQERTHELLSATGESAGEENEGE